MSFVWIAPHLNVLRMKKKNVVVVVTMAADGFNDMSFIEPMKTELTRKYGEKPYVHIGYARKENCLVMKFSREKLPDYRTLTGQNSSRIRVRFNFGTQFGIPQEKIVGGYSEMNWDEKLGMYIIPLDKRIYT